MYLIAYENKLFHFKINDTDFGSMNNEIKIKIIYNNQKISIIQCLNVFSIYMLLTNYEKCP